MQKRRDAGQALPIYITVVASLLFVAFAYFAVGQAAASRNGAQSAADAAALAAAQDARDQLRTGLLDSVLELGNWVDLIEGRKFGTYSACLEADRFADQNGAEVKPYGCQRLYDGREGFTISVRTQKPMGESVIPGTEKEHMEATATAVIEPKCSFKPDEEPGKGNGGNEDPNLDEGEDHEAKPFALTCDGQDRIIDPENLDLFPDAADLFSVKLAD